MNEYNRQSLAMEIRDDATSVAIDEALGASGDGHSDEPTEAENEQVEQIIQQVRIGLRVLASQLHVCI